MADDKNNKTRLLARLIFDLLGQDTFERLPDLTEALKCRCARLRIQCTADDVNAAYTLVEHVRPLVRPLSREITNRKHIERDEPSWPLSRAESLSIYTSLTQRYHVDDDHANQRGNAPEFFPKLVRVW